ncbi:DUF6345 domain-containing protein [Nocardioides sp.]|uniref:DUF6345 domain-containing protein n=1 Tax=Nocardioides sp. TaxID=35761 RepID=UPI00271E06BB|nr:DUF6345 domain-containing protein [Nocardioides sp.]MDO9455555.1 DUF6345 domain-containing protein [Nocardioides sp.]
MSTVIPTPTRSRRRLAAGLAALAVTGSTLLTIGTPDAAEAAPVHTPAMRDLEITAEAPVFAVTQTGLTTEDAARLAERAKITPRALAEDGSFSFVDAKLSDLVPSKAGRKGRDESRRPVQARTLDLPALRATKVVDRATALRLAKALLPAPQGFDVQPVVTNTRVQVSIPQRRISQNIPIDTVVSYRLSLGGAPVVGPGAKSRISINGQGRVVSLVETLRHVEQAGYVGIIGPEAAQEECVRMYGDKVAQGTPTLVYHSPALGDGSVKQLLPSYACAPGNVRQDAVSAVTGRLVPAAPEHAPQIAVGAAREGGQVDGKVSIEGGTAPYSIAWSSANVPLLASGDEVSYGLRTRSRTAPETLSVQVTDANGVSSAASVQLAAATSSGEASGYGGGGGAFADVGIEQTVDEWQCAQDSAIGFKSVMQAKGQSVKFDFRGASAWEQDFHKKQTGGKDDKYVDDVDAQWYTGHGSPGRFTFKSNVPDSSITPGEARWGDDWNLEWLQLESCQVLKDTVAGNFGGWAQAFDRLHVLNGFTTNAWCINGGTGRRFAEYLFPTFWRGSLTVVSAWAQMARDLEPSGTTYRSVSPIGTGFVTNLGDRFWGQGSTGPDIPAASRIGFIQITGTV